MGSLASNQMEQKTSAVGRGAVLSIWPINNNLEFFRDHFYGGAESTLQNIREAMFARSQAWST
jgi:hypothetical protein